MSKLPLERILTLAPVIAILTIERVVDAVPLARTLVDAGLPVLEVTLRTPVALAAMRAIADAVPEVVLGGGTVVHPEQFAQVRDAGACFAVSPGSTPGLFSAARQSGLHYLPGVATPSEAMALAEQGLTYLKFFPAEPMGGIDTLRHYGRPLPHIRFCPTGGVTGANAADYLALDNVICIGGSWMAPLDAIAERNWVRIGQLARAAAALKPAR